MKSEFKSASELATGSEPTHTTFSFTSREGYKKRTIDYVFLEGKNVEVTGYLALPDEDKVDQVMANPCSNHPSDHYALGFAIDIK